jgi:MYXO-CTERM domain-containing protein
MKGNFATLLFRRLTAAATVLAAWGFLGAAPSAHAQGLVYVDGLDQLNSPNENMFTNTGSTLTEAIVTTAAATNSDGAWGFRPEGAAFGGFATVYESQLEDAPELQVRLTSLTALASYDVYVAYWSDQTDWGIRAGFSSAPGTNPLFNRSGVDGGSAGILASSVIWTTLPDDNPRDEANGDPNSPFINGVAGGPVPSTAQQSMYLARVGTMQASAAGRIDVYVDDPGNTTDGNRRAWFDGLAYVPTGTNIVVSALVDRGTGQITIRNTTSVGLNIASYSVSSSAGSLNSNNWDSIAVGGNATISETHPWTITSPAAPAASVTELTENETTPTNGAQLQSIPANATGDFNNDLRIDGNDQLAWQRGQGVALNAANLATWKATYGQAVTAAPGNFNLGNVWVRTPIQDITITLNLVNGQSMTITPSYSGAAIANGDFNGDGQINLTDYATLLANMDTDLSALNPAATYLRGDVNLDKVINLSDFVQFRTLYNAANGIGAFEAMVAASGGSLATVPEPGTATLVAFGLAALTAVRRRRVSPCYPSSQRGVGKMHGKTVRGVGSLVAVAVALVACFVETAAAQTTIPVNNWYIRPNLGASPITRTTQIVTAGLNTNSPTFGTLGTVDGEGATINPSDAAYGNVDDVSGWAVLPAPVILQNGQEIVLSGSVRLWGPFVNQGDAMRFGMYNGPDFTGTYDPSIHEINVTAAAIPSQWYGFQATPSSGGGNGFFDARNPSSTGNWTASIFTSTQGSNRWFIDAVGATGVGDHDNNPATAPVARTQTPNNRVIGLSAGPAVGPFSANMTTGISYNFRMTLGRYGFENTMSLSFTSTETTPNYNFNLSATASPSQDTIPSFITYEFDRVGFLLSASMNTDQAALSNVNFTVQQIQSLILDVNTATGAMRIRNSSGTPFTINGYRITSPSGALNTSGWVSLDDGEGGDPIGVGWDESGGASANGFSEVNLLGSRTLQSSPTATPQSSFSLGNAFKTAPGTQQDLVFFFSGPDGSIKRGVLNYNTTSTAGAVPEPGSMALAAMGVAALWGVRRRRGK